MNLTQAVLALLLLQIYRSLVRVFLWVQAGALQFTRFDMYRRAREHLAALMLIFRASGSTSNLAM